MTPRAPSAIGNRVRAEWRQRAPVVRTARPARARSAVPRDTIGVLGRHAQAAVLGVFDIDILAFDSTHAIGDADETVVATDAVVHVDDEFALFQIAEEPLARVD